MAHVIYDGNGSDGGQVPVDSNTYASGATVNVAAPGNLSRTGAVFLYWNTAANGGGTIQDSSTTFPFPNQTGDLTLYAQWGVTTGLTGGGVTAHYEFFYDESLGGPGGIEPARTNAVIAACEADFAWMQIQFAGVDINKANNTNGISLPIPTYVTALGGWSASWWPLKLNPGTAAPATLVRAAMVMEVVEMFMQAQHMGWGYSAGVGDEESCGEALSQFLTVQFQISISASPAFYGSSNAWLNSSLPASNPASTEFDGKIHYGSRADYVNSTLPFAGNGPGTGGSLLFIYYLFQQLDFSAASIVGAAPGLDSNNNLIGGSCLRGVYRNLTGDTSDPFPYFASLLATAFPPNQVASIPGPNGDNPYPLGTLSFVVDKSTFGKDEVQDVVSPPQNGTFPKAFWLTIDGFNTRALAAFLLTGRPSLSGAALNFPGISITPNPSGAEYQAGVLSDVPQRVSLPFDVKFNSSSVSGFPAKNAAPLQEELDASITIEGKTYNASTLLEFTGGADPYFTNVDPAQRNVFYLSQDLRVFAATPFLTTTPVTGGPLFGSDSVSGAYSYIQQLITYLNANYSDPAGTDPFNTILPGQAEAYTGDSSVTPTTAVGIAEGQDVGIFNNYNFALARVRLRGATGEQANNVKTFFRLWSTQTADTDYQTGSTYPSHLDSRGLPDWPLPASDGHTIPFFATGNNPNLSDPSNLEYGTNGVNNQTITINAGDSRWAYFGCFLNIYDQANTVNGAPVQSLLTGTHHCIVAQIAYDDAPIINANGITKSPENSDKLAQRNLEITLSANPGPQDTHRIPQTFNVRPSGPLTEGQSDLTNYPDELMIDWGNTPVGSTASIYWPQVNTPQLLQLASRLYGTHQLTAADSHTIQCKVGRGITYVPIPPDTGQDFAGLLTVDLPLTVVRGEEFNIVLRRISTRRQIIIFRPRTESNKHSTESGPIPTPISRTMSNWRYVVGTFQVKIPVTTEDVMLWPEENTLAIFKWRLQVMSPTNRWYPVLQRYVDYLSARVAGLGGNPDQIMPSPTGVPAPRPVRREFSGKVCEVIYDCFGDLEGFVLCTCEENKHLFRTREKAIGEIALRALRHRLLLSVYTDRRNLQTVHRIVVRS